MLGKKKKHSENITRYCLRAAAIGLPRSHCIATLPVITMTGLSGTILLAVFRSLDLGKLVEMGLSTRTISMSRWWQRWLNEGNRAIIMRLHHCLHAVSHMCKRMHTMNPHTHD